MRLDQSVTDEHFQPGANFGRLRYVQEVRQLRCIRCGEASVQHCHSKAANERPDLSATSLTKVGSEMEVLYLQT